MCEFTRQISSCNYRFCVSYYNHTIILFSTSPLKTSSKYSLFRPISSNICQPTELLCAALPSDVLSTHSVYVDHCLSQMSLEECYPYQLYTDNQSQFYDIQQFENSSCSSMALHNVANSHNMFQSVSRKHKSDNDCLIHSTVG